MSSQHPGAIGVKESKVQISDPCRLVITKPCVFRWLSRLTSLKKSSFCLVIGDFGKETATGDFTKFRSRTFPWRKSNFCSNPTQSENLPTKMSFLASSHFNNTELVLGTYKHLFKSQVKIVGFTKSNTPCCFHPPKKHEVAPFLTPVNGHFMALLTRWCDLRALIDDEAVAIRWVIIWVFFSKKNTTWELFIESGTSWW